MVVRCLGARLFCWFVVGRVLVVGLGMGVLLAVGGRARCRVHSQHPGPLCCVGVVLGFGPSAGVLRCVGVAGGCGGLFVICIVVASIFVVCARPLLFLLFVLRSRVGCGGRAARGPAAVVVVGLWVCFLLCGFVGRSVDALAPRADEGRCGLRYAPGSWRASFDPGVSEWGNLAWVVLGHHHLNVYRVVGGTRGSETSQYP